MIGTRPAADPELYLAVRAAEQRLYTDDVVATLPVVAPGVPHRDEWRRREASARRLEAYFRRLARPLRLLDLGCGNGWLAARLARIDGCSVWGFDTNRQELAQAGRVFRRPRLAFTEGDIESPPFAAGAFDAVCIASSIQYFDDLPGLLRRLLRLTGPDGEVHILDSPLYADSDVAAARERSREYYEGLGFPEMAARYHHHTESSLRGFDVETRYDPAAWPARLRRGLGAPDSPFRWLRVKDRA